MGKTGDFWTFRRNISEKGRVEDITRLKNMLKMGNLVRGASMTLSERKLSLMTKKITV